MTRPDLQNVAPFYKGYVEYVKDLDMLEALVQSGKLTVDLYRKRKATIAINRRSGV